MLDINKIRQSRKWVESFLSKEKAIKGFIFQNYCVRCGLRVYLNVLI